MTAKDWILLLTPIICNGILFYIMQMYLKRYFDKKDRVHEQNNSAYRKLIICLDYAQKSLYSLIHNNFNTNPERFQHCFNDAASKIHEVKRINDGNVDFYSEFSEDLASIYNIWDSITLRLKDVISNQCGTLTAHDEEFLSTKFHILYEAISVLHSKISKNIL